MRWNIVIAAVALVLCVALVAGQKDSGPPKGTPKRSTGSADNKDSVKDAGKDTTKNEKPKPSPEAKVEAEKIAPKPPAKDESILNTKQKDAGNDAAKNEKPKPPPKAKVETVKSAPKPPAKDERTLNTKPEPAKAAPQVQATVDALNEKGLGKLKSARILVMLPMPFYSHTKNFLPIFEELAKRGHKITMVSPFPQKKPLPNWEDIVTENVLYKMLANMNMTEITEMNKSFVSKVIGILFFGKATTKLLFELQPVIDLYNDNSREFDLVFVEAQFVQEPLLAFGWKYKAPVIALYPTYITPEVAYYTGNPVLTTNYVPNMVYGHSNKMNFLERFENTMYAVGKLLVYNLYYLPLMDSLVKEHFPAPDMPSIADMLFNVSFTLMDANLALAYPYPRANNIREFLGINTKPDVPLEPEIQQIMDGADQNGVLLFTLGSTFTASSLSSHVIESLMYTFSKIPQKVIMKWDKDEPPVNLPANVHIVKWLPQAGILRHKNCRAFFTHTGVHGLMEAMDHGVPVISMPLFADQDFFANWVQENGVGLRVDFRTVTSKECLRVVSDVLNNPKYKENAVGVSIKMKDTPMPTLDEVVYWVEHVLRTKGARHLRPGSLNLWWYQRFGLDVLALALVVVLVPIWLMLFITRKCLSLVCRSKPNGSKTEKKKLKSKKDD